MVVIVLVLDSSAREDGGSLSFATRARARKAVIAKRLVSLRERFGIIIEI